jgi:hypothetical protein
MPGPGTPERPVGTVDGHGADVHGPDPLMPVAGSTPERPAERST